MTSSGWKLQSLSSTSHCDPQHSLLGESIASKGEAPGDLALTGAKRIWSTGQGTKLRILGGRASRGGRGKTGPASLGHGCSDTTQAWIGLETYPEQGRPNTAEAQSRSGQTARLSKSRPALGCLSNPKPRTHPNSLSTSVTGQTCLCLANT